MVILGIDPGIATVGFGVIAAANGRFGAIEYGAIITKPHQLLETRLCEIHDAVTELIRRHKPDCMAIEELFFNVNVKTAVDVCHGRGGDSAGGRQAGAGHLRIHAPADQAVGRRLRAGREAQVMYMTRLLLGLDEVPKPDDTADALACAICHANHKMHNYGR